MILSDFVPLIIMISAKPWFTRVNALPVATRGQVMYLSKEHL